MVGVLCVGAVGLRDLGGPAVPALFFMGRGIAMETMISPVCKSAAHDPEFEALQLWLDAQTWLEVPYEIDASEAETFATVLDPGNSSEDDEILVALLALAHSPLRRAGEALQHYAAAPHPGFRYLALEEWQIWSARGLLWRVA